MSFRTWWNDEYQYQCGIWRRRDFDNCLHYTAFAPAHVPEMIERDYRRAREVWVRDRCGMIRWYKLVGGEWRELVHLRNDGLPKKVRETQRV